MQVQRYPSRPSLTTSFRPSLLPTTRTPHLSTPSSCLVVQVRKHEDGMWNVNCHKDDTQRWSVTVMMSLLYKRFVFVRAYMKLRVDVSRSHTKVMNLYHKYVMLNLKDSTRITVRVRYIRYLQPSFRPRQIPPLSLRYVCFVR